MCRPDGRHVFFKGKVQMITYLLSKNETLNISPSPVRIFITNAIRIEVMPECPPEFFRVLIQGLKDHA